MVVVSQQVTECSTRSHAPVGGHSIRSRRDLIIALQTNAFQNIQHMVREKANNIQITQAEQKGEGEHGRNKEELGTDVETRLLSGGPAGTGDSIRVRGQLLNRGQHLLGLFETIDLLPEFNRSRIRRPRIIPLQLLLCPL